MLRYLKRREAVLPELDLPIQRLWKNVLTNPPTPIFFNKKLISLKPRIPVNQKLEYFTEIFNHADLSNVYLHAGTYKVIAGIGLINHMRFDNCLIRCFIVSKEEYRLAMLFEGQVELHIDMLAEELREKEEYHLANFGGGQLDLSAETEAYTMETSDDAIEKLLDEFLNIRGL
jgi:hypothetical protein